MAYETLCVTVRGFSHAKENIPCEDYGLVRHEKGFWVFVVSDGHGDSNCPRSSTGSRAVCEITADELIAFASSIKKANWCDRLLDPAYSDELARQLITSIVGKWKEYVIDDYALNPLSEEERKGCEKYIARYDKGERIDHIYGATMIAGLMTDRYTLLLQQGDGRCDVFDMDGNVTQPIPWDESCFANITTSMCDVDAAKKCRYYLSDNAVTPISAILAGSDGVEDSFLSMDQVHAYYRKLLCRAATDGTKTLESELKQELPAFSEKGSGDDITICGFIDEIAVWQLAERFEKDNAEVEKAIRLSDIESRLSSMEGKVDFLQKEKVAMLAKFKKLDATYRQAQEKTGAYDLALRGLLQQIDSSEFSEASSSFRNFYRNIIVKGIESEHQKAEAAARAASEALEQFEGEKSAITKEYEEIISRQQKYLHEKDQLITGELASSEETDGSLVQSANNFEEQSSTEQKERKGFCLNELCGSFGNCWNFIKGSFNGNK